MRATRTTVPHTSQAEYGGSPRTTERAGAHSLQFGTYTLRAAGLPAALADRPVPSCVASLTRGVNDQLPSDVCSGRAACPEPLIGDHVAAYHKYLVGLGEDRSGVVTVGSGGLRCALAAPSSAPPGGAFAIRKRRPVVNSGGATPAVRPAARARIAVTWGNHAQSSLSHNPPLTAGTGAEVPCSTLNRPCKWRSTVQHAVQDELDIS